MFLLSEKYRLELHWEKAYYEQEGFCRFTNAYFSGPVLSQAEQIENNNNMTLDFCSQYSFIINIVYLAKFFWGEVKYQNKRVMLEDTRLTYDVDVLKIPTLKDDDYFVIDTSKHDTANHAYSLLYETYVVNYDGDLYNFR